MFADERDIGRLVRARRVAARGRYYHDDAVTSFEPMFEQAFKNIDDVLWKEAGCTTERDYTEQTSWLLFLKYLDALEQDKAAEAAMEGKRINRRPER